MGGRLLRRNLSAQWLDEPSDRRFVARASDNAVTVLSTADLSFQGAFPVAMYPMAMAQGPGGRLVVVEYKGGGIGPESRGTRSNLKGTATVVDVDALDLAAETEQVDRRFSSPQDRFPFECDVLFPIPSREGQASPIEHVVRIVNENKTVDCLFGDMGDEVPGLTVDPEYLRWDADTTPNKRAILSQFAVSDNVYTDALGSDSGHLMRTATHRTHWVEWMWNDTARNGGSFTWPVDDAAMPEVGNFFSHLLEHDREIAIYSEIVGLLAETSDGRQAVDHADDDFPGGPAVNSAVTDEEKAEYVVERIEEDGRVDFTDILLPNNHGAGTEPAALYDAYRLWKMGRLTRAQAEARLSQPHPALPDDWWEALEEEGLEETFAFDRGIARWRRYAEPRGLPIPPVTSELDLPDTDPDTWEEPEEDD